MGNWEVGLWHFGGSRGTDVFEQAEDGFYHILPWDLGEY
jgi:hypothetical protein